MFFVSSLEIPTDVFRGEELGGLKWFNQKRKGEGKRNLHTFHTYRKTYNKYGKMLITGEHK